MADTTITIYICIVAAVIGTVFGSFINCCAWRIVRGENFISGKSHCAVCGHPLGFLDLIPVFSWLFLKGRCRYCGEKISPRYMLTELLMGAAGALLVLRFGLSTVTVRYFGLCVILLGLSLTDLDSRKIPDGFIIAGIVWWLVTIPAIAGPNGFPVFGIRGLTEGLSAVASGTESAVCEAGIGSLTHAGSMIQELKYGLIGGFGIGGGMLAISLLFDFVMKKESLGGGDIKLFFMTGLYLGLGIGLFNLLLSCLAGLLMSAVLKKRKIPFGPAISLATFVSIMFGPTVIRWYVSLLL